MPSPDQKPGLLAQIFGAGFAVLRHRNLRRNLLLGLTIASLLMAVAGITPLTSGLMRDPFWFAIYWGGCLLLVLLLLMLAVYDMLRVRRDYRRNLRELETRLREEQEAAREKELRAGKDG